MVDISSRLESILSHHCFPNTQQTPVVELSRDLNKPLSAMIQDDILSYTKCPLDEMYDYLRLLISDVSLGNVADMNGLGELDNYRFYWLLCNWVLLLIYSETCL